MFMSYITTVLSDVNVGSLLGTFFSYSLGKVFCFGVRFRIKVSIHNQSPSLDRNGENRSAVGVGKLKGSLWIVCHAVEWHFICHGNAEWATDEREQWQKGEEQVCVCVRCALSVRNHNQMLLSPLLHTAYRSFIAIKKQYFYVTIRTVK